MCIEALKKTDRLHKAAVHTSDVVVLDVSTRVWCGGCHDSFSWVANQRRCFIWLLVNLLIIVSWVKWSVKLMLSVAAHVHVLYIHWCIRRLSQFPYNAFLFFQSDSPVPEPVLHKAQELHFQRCRWTHPHLHCHRSRPKDYWCCLRHSHFSLHCTQPHFVLHRWGFFWGKCLPFYDFLILSQGGHEQNSFPPSHLLFLTNNFS